MKLLNEEKRAMIKLVSPYTSSSLHWMTLILGLDCPISIEDLEGYTAHLRTNNFYLFPEFKAYALLINIPG
jgi:hypothetical protein